MEANEVFKYRKQARDKRDRLLVWYRTWIRGWISNSYYRLLSCLKPDERSAQRIYKSLKSSRRV
jgi:hypothetical protein